MSAAANILSKVFNTLNGGAICAYVDDEGYVSSVTSCRNYNEYIFLLGNLIYRLSKSPDLTTKQILDDVAHAAFFHESLEPKMRQMEAQS